MGWLALLRLRGAAGGMAIAIPLLVGAAPAEAQTIEDRRFCSDTAANVVFYFDVTTPYDEADKTALVSGITAVFDSLEGGERFSIRTIEDAFSSGDRLLDMCVPYCESQGFFGDLFSECTEGVVINEKKRLRAAVGAALSHRLAGAIELPHSEIVRTISMSAAEEYRPGRPNRYYIFSDMIENSAYIPGKVFFSSDVEALIGKLADDGLIPDLLDADVRAFGVGRTGISASREPLPQERLEQLNGFWQMYFKAAGATLHVQQNLTAAE